jgi:hypothetical protein
MTSSLDLRAMGFCGADDSVDPKLLQLISIHYPWIEWGVLFRPDLEGTPRYATMEWVHRLSHLAKMVPMKLAAHLCGSRCQDILAGDAIFALELATLGFKRIQVNATAANNVHVDRTKLADYISGITSCMASVPQVEWIIQCNKETKPIWQALVDSPSPNMSILFDASCGLGVPMTEFPKPIGSIPCGYAGGIGPETIENILPRIIEASAGAPVWIDMESSLRTKVVDHKGGSNSSEKDIFSIDKCFACIRLGVDHWGLLEQSSCE